MGAQSLTQLLTIFLAISIIILFVLIVVFIMLALKKKNEESSTKKEADIKLKEQPKISSNTIQTKMYTIENVKKFMDL